MGSDLILPFRSSSYLITWSSLVSIQLEVGKFEFVIYIKIDTFLNLSCEIKA